MLHVCAMIWDHNKNSKPFSRCYTDEWINRLYRGFKRNLTCSFRVVAFTDRKREFMPGVDQELITSTKSPHFGCMIEPFRLNEPMIFVGLDTVIVGNIDHLADYCLVARDLALPRDLYTPERSINGVALVPAGHRWIYDDWLEDGGQANDMVWLRQYPNVWIDDTWPGHVIGYKWLTVHNGSRLDDARIVYMAGRPKMNDLGHVDWIRKHWK